MKVQIDGIDRLLKKCSPEILREPLKNFWSRVGVTVQNRAREKATVDTGRLRSSIAFEVDERPVSLWVKVGTNVQYAPYMEFGTGLFAEGTGGKGGRHSPPGAALDVWASRHGFASGYQVARIISKRGGLKPRRFLRGALEESIGDIRSLVTKLGQDIRARWESR